MLENGLEYWGHWGLSPHPLVDLRRLGSLPPNPQLNTAVTCFKYLKIKAAYLIYLSEGLWAP